MQNERSSNTQLLGLQVISLPPSQLVALTRTLEDSVEYFLSTLQKDAKKRVNSRTEKLLCDSQTPTHTRTFSASVHEPAVQRQEAKINTKIPSVPVWHNSRVHNKHTAPTTNAKHIISFSALPNKITQDNIPDKWHTTWALQCPTKSWPPGLQQHVTHFAWQRRSCGVPPVQRTTTISSAFLATDHA